MARIEQLFEQIAIDKKEIETSKEYKCRICRGQHHVADCPIKMEHNQKTAKVGRDKHGICCFWDPFIDSTKQQNNSCVHNCPYTHFSPEEFHEFCTNKMKTNIYELKDIAHEYMFCHNFSCLASICVLLNDAYPNNAKYIRLYAVALDRLGDIENADTFYVKAINLSPTDDRSHREYACFLHQSMGKLSTAKQYFRTALLLSDENPTTHCDYAILLEAMENFRESEFEYQRALELEPFHAVKCTVVCL